MSPQGRTVVVPELDIDPDHTTVPTEEHMTDIYRTVLKLDSDRALALYRAGYTRLDDLEGVGVDALIKVDGINPTIARKIVRSVEGIFSE